MQTSGWFLPVLSKLALSHLLESQLVGEKAPCQKMLNLKNEGV